MSTNKVQKKRLKRMWSLKRKFTSLLTVSIFAFTQIGGVPQGWSATANPFPREVTVAPQFDLTLPPELGTIQTINAGPGPTLIHIQTAHGNYEAQKKIEAILHHLKDTYGIKLLLLEGTSFKLDPERLHFFPKRMDLTKKVAEDLAKKALIKGSELFLLDAEGGEAYGIENRDAYVSNGRAFVDVITQKEVTEKFLQDMDRQIKRLASPYLASNLRSFLKQLERFEAKTFPFIEWLNYLKTQAKEHLEIDLANPSYQLEWPMLFRIFKLKEFESKLNMAAFQKERQAFLKEIKRILKETYQEIEKLLTSPLSQHQLPDPETGLLFEKMVSHLPRSFRYESYPNVSLFIGHLILQSELKGERLVKEMDLLVDEVSRKLADTKEAKQLLTLLRDYRLLRRLFDLELTPKDYEEFIKRGDDIRPSSILKRFLELNHTQRVQNTEFSHLEEIESLFEKALEFYRGVKERDRFLLENIESRLRETGEKKAVVITGGFHSDPFSTYFKTKGYNYALIAPKITTVEGREAYLEATLQNSPTIFVTETREGPFPFAVKISQESNQEVGNRLWAIDQLIHSELQLAEREGFLPEIDEGANKNAKLHGFGYKSPIRSRSGEMGVLIKVDGSQVTAGKETWTFTNFIPFGRKQKQEIVIKKESPTLDLKRSRHQIIRQQGYHPVTEGPPSRPVFLRRTPRRPSSAIEATLSRAEVRVDEARLRELISQLQSQDRAIRLHAARALRDRDLYKLFGSIPSSNLLDEVVTALMIAMQDPDIEFRQEVAATIKELQDYGVRIFQRPEGEAGTKFYARTIQELSKDKDSVTLTQQLEEAIQKEDFRSQITLAEDLGKIGPEAKDSVPTLVKLLDYAMLKGHFGVQMAAAEALGKIGPDAKEAVATLVELLGYAVRKRKHYGVQAAVAEALAKIGPTATSALPMLREILKEPLDSEVEWQASRARFGSEEEQAFAEFLDSPTKSKLMALIAILKILELEGPLYYRADSGLLEYKVGNQKIQINNYQELKERLLDLIPIETQILKGNIIQFMVAGRLATAHQDNLEEIVAAVNYVIFRRAEVRSQESQPDVLSRLAEDEYYTKIVPLILGLDVLAKRLLSEEGESYETISGIFNEIYNSYYPDEEVKSVPEKLRSFVQKIQKIQESADSDKVYEFLKQIILAVLKETGEDLIASGALATFARAADQGNPWVFEKLGSVLETDPVLQQLDRDQDKKYRGEILQRRARYLIDAEAYEQMVRPFSVHLFPYYPKDDQRHRTDPFTQAVIAFKRQEPLPLGNIISESADKITELLPWESVDFILPVPPSSNRLYTNRLLAWQVKQVLGERGSALEILDDAIVQQRNRGAQRSVRRYGDRASNIAGVLSLNKNNLARLRNSHVVLLDDVRTTGLTVDEAKRILYDAGVRKVTIFTLGVSVPRGDRLSLTPEQEQKEEFLSEILAEDQPLIASVYDALNTNEASRFFSERTWKFLYSIIDQAIERRPLTERQWTTIQEILKEFSEKVKGEVVPPSSPQTENVYKETWDLYTELRRIVKNKSELARFATPIELTFLRPIDTLSSLLEERKRVVPLVKDLRTRMDRFQRGELVWKSLPREALAFIMYVNYGEARDPYDGKITRIEFDRFIRNAIDPQTKKIKEALKRGFKRQNFPKTGLFGGLLPETPYLESAFSWIEASLESSTQAPELPLRVAPSKILTFMTYTERQAFVSEILSKLKNHEMIVRQLLGIYSLYRRTDKNKSQVGWLRNRILEQIDQITGVDLKRDLTQEFEEVNQKVLASPQPPLPLLVREEERKASDFAGDRASEREALYSDVRPSFYLDDDQVVYYPGPGFDLAGVLAAIDARTYVLADIMDWRHRKKVVKDLEESIPPLKGKLTVEEIAKERALRLTFHLWGRDRVVVYRFTTDADVTDETYFPNEILNGFDVLYLHGFIPGKITLSMLSALMRVGGRVLNTTRSPHSIKEKTAEDFHRDLLYHTAMKIKGGQFATIVRGAFIKEVIQRYEEAESQLTPEQKTNFFNELENVFRNLPSINSGEKKNEALQKITRLSENLEQMIRRAEVRAKPGSGEERSEVVRSEVRVSFSEDVMALVEQEITPAVRQNFHGPMNGTLSRRFETFGRVFQEVALGYLGIEPAFAQTGVSGPIDFTKIEQEISTLGPLKSYFPPRIESQPALPRALYDYRSVFSENPEDYDLVILQAAADRNLKLTLWLNATEDQLGTLQTELTQYARSRYGFYPKNLKIEVAPQNILGELFARARKGKVPTGFVSSTPEILPKINAGRGIILAVGSVESTTVQNLTATLLAARLRNFSFNQLDPRIYRGEDLAKGRWAELFAFLEARQAMLAAA